MNAGNKEGSVSSDGANELFQTMEMQHITDPGTPTIALATQQYTQAIISNKNAKEPERINSMSNIDSSTDIKHQLKQKPTKTNTYCIIVYKILLHLLLLYVVIAVTYLLVLNYYNDCKCSNNSGVALDSNQDLSTYSPTHTPATLDALTTNPPTKLPSISPSMTPTIYPSISPTLFPTEYYEKYDHFVGDYKISA
eukprot:352079_1